MVYKDIKVLVEKYEAFIHIVENEKGLARLELKLGMLYYGVGLHYAYPLVKSFRAKHPTVRLTTISSQPNQIIAKLQDDSIDACISVYSRFAVFDGINHIAIAQEPLVAIMPASHPLATQHEISLKQLVGQRILMMRMEAQLEMHLRTLFRYHDLELKDVVYTEHIDTMCLDLEQSCGIFIGTRQLTSLLTDAVFVPLTANDLFLDVGLLYRSDNDNPALVLMIDCLPL